MIYWQAVGGYNWVCNNNHIVKLHIQMLQEMIFAYIKLAAMVDYVNFLKNGKKAGPV